MIPTHFPEVVPLLALVFAVALLYSSGGHAGASAYLAIFGLYALAPAAMRPTVPGMNIALATIGSVRFIRARAVPRPLLGPQGEGRRRDARRDRAGRRPAATTVGFPSAVALHSWCLDLLEPSPSRR